MNTSVSIPATVQIKRGRLVGLVAGAAVLAAAVTWVVLTFAVDAGSSTSQAAAPRVVATPLTPAQRSIGSYLFGVSSRAHAGPGSDDPRLRGRSSHPAHVGRAEHRVVSVRIVHRAHSGPGSDDPELQDGSGDSAHAGRAEHRLLPVRSVDTGSPRLSWRWSATTKRAHAEPSSTGRSAAGGRARSDQRARPPRFDVTRYATTSHNPGLIPEGRGRQS